MHFLNIICQPVSTNRRNIIVFILLLTCFLVYSCGDDDKQKRIDSLKNELNNINREIASVELQLKEAKDKQGFFSRLFSDSEEVKSLKEKKAKLINEFNTKSKELAELEGKKDYPMWVESLINLADIFAERLSR